MKQDRFDHYRKLKAGSPQAPMPALGRVLDEWIEEFLREKPTKEQFVEILNGAHCSSNLFWALWSIK